MSVDIAIYGKDYFTNLGINSTLAVELSNKRINCKIDVYKETELINGEYDIYLLECLSWQDLRNIEEYINTLNHTFVFTVMSPNKDYHYDSMEIGASKFLLYPLEEAKLLEIVHDLIASIGKEDFTIEQGNKTTTLRNVSDLLFAELNGRKIYYYFENGDIIESKDVRASFKTETALLADYKTMYYMTKTKIINLSKVEAINSNYITFNDPNKTTLYYPASAKMALKEKWRNYYNLDD